MKSISLVKRLMKFAEKILAALESDEQQIKEREGRLKNDKSELAEAKAFIKKLLG